MSNIFIQTRGCYVDMPVIKNLLFFFALCANTKVCYCYENESVNMYAPTNKLSYVRLEQSNIRRTGVKLKN